MEKITDFNLLFQSNEGLIGTLYTDLLFLYKSLLQLFYKIDKLSNEEILNVDLNDKSKYLSDKELCFSIKYNCYRETLNLESHEERTHHKNLINFLVRAVTEIKERFLVNCDDLKLLGFLDPGVILSINNPIFHFTKLLQRFNFINDVNISTKIDDEFRSFILDQERIKILVASQEKKFKINYDIKIKENKNKKNPVDLSKIKLEMITPVKYWKLIRDLKKSNNSFSYINLSNFCLTLLSLPHSNAEPERVFHLQKLNKTQLRNKLSTNTTDSILLAHSAFKFSNNTVENWIPDKKMLKLFKKENELTYVNEDDKVFEDEILDQ